MKVFRFMSKNEFDAYMNGDTLKNYVKHTAYTNSKGFCFMNLEDYEPEYAYQFLSGIVSTGVCVVFETNEILTKSYGIYAEPYGSFFDSFVSDEYCIEKYNKKDFRLIKYCYDFDEKRWSGEEWTWLENKED